MCVRSVKLDSLICFFEIRILFFLHVPACVCVGYFVCVRSVKSDSDLFFLKSFFLLLLPAVL